MNKLVKMLKIYRDEYGNVKHEWVHQEASCPAYYKAIDCSCIDITQSSIPDLAFVVDDEGFFKDNPIPTTYSMSHQNLLFGTVFLAQFDQEGSEVSMDDDHVKRVTENLKLGRVKYEGRDMVVVAI